MINRHISEDSGGWIGRNYCLTDEQCTFIHRKFLPNSLKLYTYEEYIIPDIVHHILRMS